MDRGDEVGDTSDGSPRGMAWRVMIEKAAVRRRRRGRPIGRGPLARRVGVDSLTPEVSSSGRNGLQTSCSGSIPLPASRTRGWSCARAGLLPGEL